MDDFHTQLQAFSQRVRKKESNIEIESNKIIDASEKEVVLYQTETGNVDVSVFYHNETFWLTQKALGELFGVDRTVITKHLGNIFAEGELDKNSVCAIFAHTAADGKTYPTQFYNLDAIISVGYRVNSIQATRFRQWATATLKDYIIKRFVLNDEFLKNGPKFGKDYFDELLERIKEIRASERRFYQKITDIYAENQAKRNKLMSMNDWITKLDSFLQFNEYDLLDNLGQISRAVAEQLAIDEYEKYRVIQDQVYSSDFDKISQKYLK